MVDSIEQPVDVNINDPILGDQKKILSTVAKNTFYSISGRFINFVSVPLFNIIAANKLGPASYGTLAISLSWIALAQVLSEAGMGTFITREIAYAPTKASYFFTSGLMINALGSVLSIVGIWFSSLLMPDSIAKDSSRILILGVFFLSILRLNEGVCAGQQRFDYQIIPSALRNIFTLLICSSFLFFFNPNILVLCVLLVIVWMSASLTSTFIIKPKFIGQLVVPEGKFILATFKSALPFLLMPLVATLYYRNTIWLLSYLKGSHDTGVFQASYSILEWTITLPSLLAGVLLPTLADIYSKDKKFFFRTFTIYLKNAALIAPMIVGLGLFVSTVILPNYKQGYEESYSLGLKLSLIAAPMTINNLLGISLIVSKRPFYPVVAMLLGFIMNITMNLLLIPKLGIVGTAFSMLLSEYLAMTIQAFGSKDFFDRDGFREILKIVLSITLGLSFIIYVVWLHLGFLFGGLLLVVYMIFWSKSKSGKLIIDILVSNMTKYFFSCGIKLGLK